MTWSILVPFLLTIVLMDLTPGPAVMKVIGDSLGNGWKRAQASIAGILLGNVLCCLLSIFGLSAFLLASPAAFELIKWAGALYLCWLGLQTVLKWRSALEIGSSSAPSVTRGTLFRSSLVTQTSNPKSILYFSAILPAFAPSGRDALYVMLALGAMSLVTEYVVLSSYSMLSGYLRLFASSAPAQHTLSLLSAAALFAVAAMVVRTSLRAS